MSSSSADDDLTPLLQRYSPRRRPRIATASNLDPYLHVRRGESSTMSLAASTVVSGGEHENTQSSVQKAAARLDVIKAVVNVMVAAALVSVVLTASVVTAVSTLSISTQKSTILSGASALSVLVSWTITASLFRLFDVIHERHQTQRQNLLDIERWAAEGGPAAYHVRCVMLLRRLGVSTQAAALVAEDLVLNRDRMLRFVARIDIQNDRAMETHHVGGVWSCAWRALGAFVAGLGPVVPFFVTVVGIRAWFASTLVAFFLVVFLVGVKSWTQAETSARELGVAVMETTFIGFTGVAASSAIALLVRPWAF
jgi:hypothetical protein